MEKQDFRTLSKDARNALRRRAIILLNKGKTQTEVSEIIGVRKNTVGKWKKAYQTGGQRELSEKTRGRKEGMKRTLSMEQEKEIQRDIIDRHPEQLKLAFALWTRVAVQELIYTKYQIRMPIRTVGEYLKRWGFTPKKPVKLAYEQQPEKVKEWLETEYPKIKKQAKQENAVIHWGDETGVNSESYVSRGYSPKGIKAVVKTTGKRFSISMISVITNEGQMSYMIYKGALVTDTFIEFLRRLISGSERKIYLILDNLKVHHAIRVQKWVKKRPDKIELFFLPPYTPEHNPDEYLNQDVKLEISKRPKPRNEKQLKSILKSHMCKTQRNKEKVRNFFNHPKVRYASISI